MASSRVGPEGGIALLKALTQSTVRFAMEELSCYLEHMKVAGMASRNVDVAKC
jgi:hypothetical protein